ncbi:MAG: tRNA (adenosine(37)-N6)-threonylcarbamoyltransferase complex ATPase subunit type 1 TsaE [Dongiaceae bacterium]
MLGLSTESATVRLAEGIAAMVHVGDVIALSGELGVGKTRLARAFIGALMEDAEEVPSPTFTLVQTYETLAGTVWHFDLYRLSGPDEVFELGFEDALAEGISLIEWPERLRGLLPNDRLDVELAFDSAADGARNVRLVGHGDWSQRLADRPIDV